MKVNGLNEMAQIIEEETIIRNHGKKAKRVLVAERVKELIAQGIDKELAKIMANIEYDYSL